MNTFILNHTRQVLKWAYGLLFVAVGIDKIFHTYWVTDWSKYVSPMVTNSVPLSPPNFLIVWGIIEVVVGIFIFIKPKIGAWLGIITFLLIVINLIVMGGYLDIAVRDTLAIISL